MHDNDASPAQDDYLIPVAFSLTPQDIAHTYGATATTFMAGDHNIIESHGEAVAWEHRVSQARTGYECRIAALESSVFSEEDGSSSAECEYVVTLQVGPSSFITMIWQADALSEADMELAKTRAHEAYVGLAALLGVKVGYHLVVNPPLY